MGGQKIIHAKIFVKLIWLNKLGDNKKIEANKEEKRNICDEKKLQMNIFNLI